MIKYFGSWKKGVLWHQSDYTMMEKDSSKKEKVIS